MLSGYRILSIEAIDIVKAIQNNGFEVGLKLPKKGSNRYYDLFTNNFDYCLDLEELDRIHQKTCRKKIYFEDKVGNKYTTCIINVEFDLAPNTTRKALRKELYETGFIMDKVHYVRYKRSSGSSREGKCLFIDKRLLNKMEKWGNCDLSPNGKLASFEAYKSLTLSSLKGKINIPKNGILVIPDYKSKFEDEVIAIEAIDGQLVATCKKTIIKNDIWDGQSLLDESLFTNEFKTKHMLLLRNKFFKSCGFKTKLQKWFKDNNILDVKQLTDLGFITTANNVSEIVMVVTPNSLKYLKFKEDFTKDNIVKWMSYIDEGFGVVKYDKRTKYFNGRMTQSSYQLLNTIQLNYNESNELLNDRIRYLSTIRKDSDYLRYHFTNATNKEKNLNTENKSDGLSERAKVIFKLMDINYGFNNTELYINFKNKLVEDYKNKLLFGRVLLSGNNSTLFGNGPEMLLALTGTFKLDSNDNISVLKKGQIRSTAFNNKAKLVCARSPHITMGNLYIAENNLENEIFDYFDLGNNIVCVNAINENLQQRLNGCDYDSDMMLITDEKLIVEAASKNNHQFKVPVCNIESVKNILTDLYELDHKTSENKIGEIVNLSQKLNSIIWDELNNNENIDKINEVYHDVCKLAVLSGIEIDKAKRSFAIDSSAELRKIENKYKTFKRPTFFKDIDIKTSSKYESKVKEKDYEKYMTTMEYIYEIASKIDFRKEKQGNIEYVPISSMLNVESKPTSTDYENKTKIINICNEYEKRLSALRMKLRKSDEDEKEIVYENINQTIIERNIKVEQYLKNKNILYLVIKSLEKNKETDWNIYAPLLDHPMFIEILNGSKAKMSKVVEKEDGEFKVFKFSFTKKS